MKVQIFILISFALLAGCWKVPDTIRDMSDLPQNHLVYLNTRAEVKDLIDPAHQKKLDEDYNVIYFSVWHQRDPFYASADAVNVDFMKFRGNSGYGADRKKHSPNWYKILARAAALERYPNARYPAITTRNTNLRIVPTSKHHFFRPGKDKDWPFDNFQRSAVAVNTPIFVCHLSADKTWALVETCFTFGWMPARDFARVDEKFIQRWEAAPYAVITRDQAATIDAKVGSRLNLSLGYIFPLVRETTDKMEILTAAADTVSGNAVIKKAFISREDAVVKPLRLNSLHVVKIANELIGEPYGWGGLYGNRDCSSMTRDFFAVFGLWLPRHSEDQLKEAGFYVDLRGLTPEQKEKIIMERGVPYLTILWRKGHVMLYIGAQNGRALVFHNIWGVKTKDLRGREGRKIIGQAVITTLRPGRELRNFDYKAGDLLANIAGMSVLAVH